MSQPDDPVDPYRLPPPGHPAHPPQAGDPLYPPPAGGPLYPPPGWGPPPPGDGSLAALQAQRPPSVQRLLQVMTAGAVLTALQGVYGLLTIDRSVASATTDLDQAALDAGMDPEALLAFVTTSAWVVGVVGLVVSVGLWVLFARLFSRGSARVLGTVLGALNGLGSLFGLLSPVSAVSVLLNLVVLAVIVLGLVLLWLPTTSAWFAAVAAARRRPTWG